jgi:predicted RNA-binding protein YlqC (UPF0109 family)
MLMDPIDLSVYRLLSRIVSILVEEPEAVQITPTLQHRGVRFSVLVHREDIGQLIGVQANTAKSLRFIFVAIGVKTRRRYWIEIEEGAAVRHPALSSSSS